MSNPKDTALAPTSSAKSIQTYLPNSNQLSAVCTLPDVWRVETPSLAAVKKNFGLEAAQKLIMAWIVNITLMINVGKSMNDAQIRDAAQTIMTEFPYLTIADIKLVFQRAKTGYYGEIFDRLDVMVISRWFRTHWAERLEAAETESYHNHQATKQEGNRVATKIAQSHREAMAKYLTEKARAK